MRDFHTGAKVFGFYIIFKDPKLCQSCICADGNIIADKALYLGKLLRASDRDKVDSSLEPPTKFTRIGWLQLCPDLEAAVKEANGQASVAGRSSPVVISKH